ncbi:MAG: (2Fe-2S)-binding protein [Sarcina sp.]
MESNLVCRCMNVKKETIIKAIEMGNAKTVEDISRKTSAGTGCGRCKKTIQLILDEYQK